MQTNYYCYTPNQPIIISWFCTLTPFTKQLRQKLDTCWTELILLCFSESCLCGNLNLWLRGRMESMRISVIQDKILSQQCSWPLAAPCHLTDCVHWALQPFLPMVQHVSKYWRRVSTQTFWKALSFTIIFDLINWVLLSRKLCIDTLNSSCWLGTIVGVHATEMHFALKHLCLLVLCH